MTPVELRPALGIDVGGTNIRGAVVDFSAEMPDIGRTIACPTPQPSTPESLAEAVANVRHSLEWDGPEGIGFPARMRSGIVDAVSHLDGSWVGVEVSKQLSPESRVVIVINDADAAGLAESEYGAAAGIHGLVLVLTVGTGIGSALVHEGTLLEGTELGLVPCGSTTAQGYAAMSAIDKEELTLSDWVGRLGGVLNLYDELLAPNVIVIGGAATELVSEYSETFEVTCLVRAAHLGASAGVVGAALAAAQHHGQIR